MREPTLMVEGQLQINRDWRGVVAEKVYPLLGVFGGTAGFPSAYGEIESRWKKRKGGTCLECLEDRHAGTTTKFPGLVIAGCEHTATTGTCDTKWLPL